MAKKVFLIIGAIFILVFIVFAFLYYALFNPRYEKPIIEINREEISQNPELVVIEPIHISYILVEIGAYNLHNPPLSSNTPKMNIGVNDDWYNSEIKAGKIYTERSTISEPDLVMYTSSDEILEAINSGDVKNYFKESVSAGKTRLELKADYSKIFSKGYLSLYKELTGTGLSGSVVKIFSQG